MKPTKKRKRPRGKFVYIVRCDIKVTHTGVTLKDVPVALVTPRWYLEHETIERLWSNSHPELQLLKINRVGFGPPEEMTPAAPGEAYEGTAYEGKYAAMLNLKEHP